MESFQQDGVFDCHSLHLPSHLPLYVLHVLDHLFLRIIYLFVKEAINVSHFPINFLAN